MNNVDLDDLVIKLHDIAQRIEDNIGIGLLSEDVRRCADRLSDILRKDLRDEY